MKKCKYKRLEKINPFMQAESYLEKGKLVKKFLEDRIRDSGDSSSIDMAGLVDSAHRSFYRYKPVFDYLDNNPVETLLELGCGHGFPAWVFTDIANKVTAVDIDDNRISTGEHLFPEVDFHLSDHKEFFSKNKTQKFDVILAVYVLGSFGLKEIEEYRHRCNKLIIVGLRPFSWKESLTWSYKPKGRHISWSTTVVGEEKTGIDRNYPLYYFSPPMQYLYELRKWLKFYKVAFL